MREVIAEHRIPYHVGLCWHDTNKFMALPEVQLTPQVLLLPFMDTGTFVVFNVCLVYAVGYWGCLLIRRKYQLSLFSFTGLFLLFNFNGYVVARMGVGHMMWLAYFFLPHFVLAVLPRNSVCCGTGVSSFRPDDGATQ